MPELYVSTWFALFGMKLPRCRFLHLAAGAAALPAASQITWAPDDHGIYKGRHREYTLRTANAGEYVRYRLAILRQIEQGNGEAQEAARDLFDD